MIGTILAWMFSPLRMWRARRDLRRIKNGEFTALEMKYGIAHYEAMVADPSVTSDFWAWAAEREAEEGE